MLFAFLTLLQEGGAPSFGVVALWQQMGWEAKAIVIILFIMSVISIGVMVDRWLVYGGARKQSRSFAPAVAGALKEGRLDEAIKIAERNKKSHLAKVVTAGLAEFQAHQQSPDLSGDEIEASRRALDRAEAIEHAELKRGLGSLATIGATGPFVGLVTTAIGLFVAIPAVWAYNYFTGKVEAFDVEMDNSSSELIDYFLKRSGRT